MKIKLASLAGVTLLASGFLAQNEATPKLVCQGEYSALGRNSKGDTKTTKVDRWHMDSMQDGSYSVDVELERPKIEEHRFFTKEFKPKSFVSVLSGGGLGKPMTIECDYGATDLGCHTTFDGSSAAATIAQKPPYAFVPTFEALTFDFPWAFQAIVSQAERTIGQKTAIPLIALEDGETKNSISLKVQGVAQVEYRGREAIETLGQKILAYKFRLVDPKDPEHARDLWMSDSGILLSMTIDDSGARINLTEYQGPSLSP
jgi:hypothetical protein